MPVLNLNKRNIDSLVTPNKSQETYRDPKDTGFCLRVFKSSRKVFMLDYRMPNGSRRMLKLGDYGTLAPDKARKLARDKKADILKGEDPKEERDRSAATPTFARWVDVHLQDVRLRKKRPDADEYYLGMAVKKYGRKKLDEVTRADIQNHMKLLSKVGKTSVTANRYHASIRSCLQSAVDTGILQFNLAANIKHYPEPIPRARVLTNDEMAKVLEAIASLDDIFVKTSLYMLIETGARKTEVLSARWDDIQFDDGLWRLPDTKSGRPQIIPLSSTIIARLRLLPQLGTWVFPSPKGEGHRQDIKRAWVQVKEAAEIPDVKLHDLRRTFGLHIARSAGLHVASKLLRHSSIKVTESHYAPLGVDDLRSALEKRTADVVQLSGKRKDSITAK